MYLDSCNAFSVLSVRKVIRVIESFVFLLCLFTQTNEPRIAIVMLVDISLFLPICEILLNVSMS